MFGSRPWAMRPTEKVCLVVLWVLLLVVPGESRVSVGVDCLVSRPPSVAPRIGFRVSVTVLGFRVGPQP